MKCTNETFLFAETFTAKIYAGDYLEIMQGCPDFGGPGDQTR